MNYEILDIIFAIVIGSMPIYLGIMLLKNQPKEH